MNFVREVLFSINVDLFKFAGTIYKFIIELANETGNIMEKTPVEEYAQNIYIFVGIVMLFRLGIIILQYIANPDKVTDKKEGISQHIIPHILTVLVLMVFTPTFFKLLYDVQEIILESNVLNDLFSNVETASNGDLNEEIKKDKEKECEELQNQIDSYSRIDYGRYYSEELGDYDYYQKNSDYNDKCVSEYGGSKLTDTLFLGFMTLSSNADDDITAQYEGEEEKLASSNYDDEDGDRIDYTVLKSILNEKIGNTDENQIEYNGFISIIVAIAVMFLLAAVVFQVSLRIFKLLALEVMAPVPIILYADPTPRKKGETSLEKWFSSVLKTYADLFIRILIVLFVAKITSDILSYLSITQASIIMKIFIIIGGLLFMNIAPAFILGIFSISPEEGSFNPFTQAKKLGANPIANKVGGAASGGVSGMLKGGLNGGKLGAASGLLLGATAGAKSSKAMAWSDGRDTVGRAMANGPDATHMWLTRGAERMASDAIRSDANDIYKNAQVFEKTPKFQAAKSQYETKAEAYKNEATKLQQMEVKRNEIKSKLSAYQAQGNTAKVSHYSSALVSSNGKISKQRGVIKEAHEKYEVARKKYINEINKYNEKVTKYKKEIQKVNVATGKDQMQYKADEGSSDFKKKDTKDL